MPLQLTHISVAYGPIVAIRSFDAVVQPGQIVSIIGPNGAGKSSLLAAVAGLVAHRGEASVDGTALGRLAAHQRSRTGLGYVPSGKGVFGSLTVQDNIRVAAGPKFGPAWERLTEWFPLLRSKASAFASDLSGGQQQLVSIARAMATEPRYILLDEPSMGLSPVALQQVGEVIGMLRARGMGVLLAEQNAGLALTLADHCMIMVQGEVRLSGRPEDLRGRPEVEALYMGRSVEA